MEIESFLIFYQAVYAGTCAKSLERCISFAKHMSGHACAYKDNYSGRSFFLFMCSLTNNSIAIMIKPFFLCSTHNMCTQLSSNIQL